MNEEQTRAMIREEIRAAFQSLEDVTHAAWRGTGSDSVEEICSEMLWSSAESIVKFLAPVDDDSEVEELIEKACVHIYKSCEDAQGNGGASCVLCYEREPEPVNPFAPKRTAEQWAADIRSLIEQAQNDGYVMWVDVDYYEDAAPRIRIGTADSPEHEDPLVWDTKS